MSDTHLLALAARLRRVVEQGQWEEQEPLHWLETRRYRDEQRWAQEKQKIFGRYPLIAARSCDLAANSWLGLELVGQSILLSRNESGRARAFVNACQHRGMQLLEAGESHCKGHLSCPYHAWTYASDGRLRGLPKPAAFPDLDTTRVRLKEMACEERHGFIWVGSCPPTKAMDIANWLGGLDDDFSHFQLDQHHCFAESRSLVQANWKLCIDAFLEAYHVRVLHRTTVGPFFEDALAVTDNLGHHFRSAVARKGLREGIVDNLRDAVSFTHFVFPNQIFVFHPDYVSQMSILPRNEQQFNWHHRMLIPADQAVPELQAHWQKSFELIEGGVFQSEDLWAAQRNQRGLDSGGVDAMPLGQLETLIWHFHQNLDSALQAKDAPETIVALDQLAAQGAMPGG